MVPSCCFARVMVMVMVKVSIKQMSCNALHNLSGISLC